LRRYPAETVSSRTGVPRSRGRPPERPRCPVVIPTRPRPHARGRRDRGDSAPKPRLISIASACEATTLANRDGTAERERVGGSRPRSAERGKGKAATGPRAGTGRSRPVDTADVCGWRVVPGSRRRRSRTSRGLPRVSVRSRRSRACGGGLVGGTTNIVVAWAAVPDEGARLFSTRPTLPGATQLAVVPISGRTVTTG
jgi:hypothetical protein